MIYNKNGSKSKRKHELIGRVRVTEEVRVRTKIRTLNTKFLTFGI